MPRDADQIANLAAELDALDAPTTAEVLAHSQDYDAGIVAAEAAQRAINAGGDSGGSQTLAQVLAAGNDGDGDGMTNTGQIETGGGDIDTQNGDATVRDLSVRNLSGKTASNLSVQAGTPATEGAGKTATLQGGTANGVANGGTVFVRGGSTSEAGAGGGQVELHGGANGTDEAASIVLAGAGAGGGTIDLEAPGGLLLDGAAFGRAAHLAHGATTDQVIDALIAAGLMAAS